MSLLDVDPKKCAGDGICAAICPIGLIEFKNIGSAGASDREPI